MYIYKVKFAKFDEKAFWSNCEVRAKATSTAFVLLCFLAAPFVAIINESLVVINMCLRLISAACQTSTLFPKQKYPDHWLSRRFCLAADFFGLRDKQLHMLS